MTTKKKWYHHALFPGSRPALLLLSLFLLLAIYPRFEYGGLNASRSEHHFASLMLHIFFTLILIGSAWIVHDRRRSFVIACLLAGPWVILGWLDHFMDFTDATEGVITLFFAAATLYVAFLQVGFILRAKKVNADLLCRAVAVYLMLGVAWMALYGAAELFVPNSFDAAENALHGMKEGQIGSSDLLYYSFSTLSTLGMGDIVPLKPIVRSLTLLECVIGPLYMALLLARLVAVYGRER